MKLASLALAAAALAVSAVLPMAASAQALDDASGRQAFTDLRNDIWHAQAFTNRAFSPYSCEPVDPAVQQQAVNELNGLDQRATDLAYRTSGVLHAQTMTVVRTLESRQWTLLHPTVPESCYVAPGTSQQQQPARTPQTSFLDTDTSWTGSAGWS
jgi:hypothetical protein